MVRFYNYKKTRLKSRRRWTAVSLEPRGQGDAGLFVRNTVDIKNINPRFEPYTNGGTVYLLPSFDLHI